MKIFMFIILYMVGVTAYGANCPNLSGRYVQMGTVRPSTLEVIQTECKAVVLTETRYANLPQTDVLALDGDEHVMEVRDGEERRLRGSYNRSSGKLVIEQRWIKVLNNGSFEESSFYGYLYSKLPESDSVLVVEHYDHEGVYETEHYLKQSSRELEHYR